MTTTENNPAYVAAEIDALRPNICRLNRCGRPLGIGTHMSITGHGRAADQTIPVCEEHWQALRDIFPKESHGE